MIALAIVLCLALIACRQSPQSSSPQQPPDGIAVTDNEVVAQPYVDDSRPGPEAMIPRIIKEELRSRMDAGDDILIIDVRHREEYDIDHIKGAVWASLDEIFAGSWQPPAAGELIVYCA